MNVRPIKREDHADWRRLWSDYLRFYESTVSEAVYDATFERLFDGDATTPNALLAFVDGRAVGLVHYFLHSHAWHIEKVCYLQDLYAAPEARGSGVGRALIEAVYTQADALGAPNVYWTTQDNNETARKLYDRIGKVTPFIKYIRE